MLGKYRGKIDCTEEELSEILEEYKGSKLTCPVDEKGWVYGSLINGKTPYIVGEVRESMPHGGIVLDYWYPVKKETLGQYTGLKDKNDKEIYEGDKVEVYEPDGEVIDWGQVIYGVDCNDKNAYPYHLTCKGYADNYNMYDECEYVVIGNKYDNPELIKAE